MLSHQNFDDSMALGQSVMDTLRFELVLKTPLEIIMRSTLGFFMDTIHLVWGKLLK